MAALTLVGPAKAAAQSEASIPIHAAVELAVGTLAVGEGGGVSGKVAFRVHRGGWGIRLRERGWDGEHRELRSCFVLPAGLSVGADCSARESFSESAVLLERGETLSPGVKLFFGVGAGRLSGSRFHAPTADMVAVSETVFAFEFSSHLSITRLIQFTPAVVGHVGPDGTVAAFTLGLAIGN